MLIETRHDVADTIDLLASLGLLCLVVFPSSLKDAMMGHA